MPREVRLAVVADAARRFKVAESAVVLSQAEQVTWSDGSLGCPQRGQMYTQNLVDGYRIVAITSAGQMVYHTDSHGFAVTCGDGPGCRAPSSLRRARRPIDNNVLRNRCAPGLAGQQIKKPPRFPAGAL